MSSWRAVCLDVISVALACVVSLNVWVHVFVHSCVFLKTAFLRLLSRNLEIHCNWWLFKSPVNCFLHANALKITKKSVYDNYFLLKNYRFMLQIILCFCISLFFTFDCIDRNQKIIYQDYSYNNSKTLISSKLCATHLNNFFLMLRAHF